MHYLVPPLRLILNTDCNGKCSFCHHEGCFLSNIMDEEMVYECADIAQELSIPRLSLTGGEPTLRKDLPSLLNGIRRKYKGHISLTTNGYDLSSLCDRIDTPINSINLSIISFKEDIWKKYQNVNPYYAIESLYLFPATIKKLNVLILEENYMDIEEFFSNCITRSLSLDLMFELTESTKNNLIFQYVLKKFRCLGTPRIEYDITSTLVIDINEKCKIRIKHPYFSSLVKWHVCQQCKHSSSCFERICAIRVYSDGTVTPCLNNKVSLTKGTATMRQKVRDAYKILGNYKINKSRISDLFSQ